mgnify:CR=1 FL=1
MKVTRKKGKLNSTEVREQKRQYPCRVESCDSYYEASFKDIQEGSTVQCVGCGHEVKLGSV